MDKYIEKPGYEVALGLRGFYLVFNPMLALE